MNSTKEELRLCRSLRFSQSRPVSATIRLESATATLIDQYATFLHAPADDVVDKALNYVFSKHREFQEYLKTAQSSDVVPTLRVRRNGNGESTEPSANGRGLVAGVEVRDAIRRESVPKA
jgi:hypothetical protein